MHRVKLAALLESSHLAGPLDGNVLLQIGHTLPAGRYVEVGVLRSGAKLYALKGRNGRIRVYVSGYAYDRSDIPAEILA